MSDGSTGGADAAADSVGSGPGRGAGAAAGALGDAAKAGAGLLAQPHNPIAWAAAFKSLAKIGKYLVLLSLFIGLLLGTIVLSLFFSLNGANPIAMAASCGELLPEVTADGKPVAYTAGKADARGAKGVVAGMSAEGISEEVRSNAQTIIAVGKSMGIPDRGIVIALATASQESNLLNINYGDRDSVGLFQQRPSAGWGTVGQIMDPRYSAKKFFEALNRVGGWQQMPLTVAAQKVQISAFPDAYAKWEPLANQIFTKITGTVTPNNHFSYTTADNIADCGGFFGQTVGLMSGAPYCLAKSTQYTPPRQGPCKANEIQIVIPDDPMRKKAIEFAFAQLGKPYVWGGVGPSGFDCSGLTMGAMKAAGIGSPRTSEAQYGWDRIKKVPDVAQLSQGDLIFAGDLGHVAIYLGNNMMIHAPHTGDRVKIAPIYSRMNKFGIVPYPNQPAGITPVKTKKAA